MHIQRSGERGTTKEHWLLSKHSFSFGDYYNPKWKNFGALTVLNDDVIKPDFGFDFHPHRNMEIITLVLQGALEHEDSMGHKTTIGIGEVQVMSAGTGIEHAEFNHSDTEPVHLLQIWIEPRLRNLNPGYQQKRFILEKNSWTTLVANTRHQDWLMIFQKAKIVRGIFEAGQAIAYQPPRGNGIYLLVISGKIAVRTEELNAADALASDEKVELQSLQESDILLIEVPMK